MKFANTPTEQEQWTQLPFTHTHAHTNNNRQGDVHMQKLENKSTSMNQSVVKALEECLLGLHTVKYQIVLTVSVLKNSKTNKI